MQITDYFSQLCQHCGITALSVDANETDDQKEVVIKVSPEDADLLIGRNGETILSLQRLARASFATQDPTKRLVVNVNDYRQQREEKLKGILVDVANRALGSGLSVAFPIPLSSAERYYVHTALAEMPEFGKLESLSLGEGRSRRLIVQPKGAASNE